MMLVPSMNTFQEKYTYLYLIYHGIHVGGKRIRTSLMFVRRVAISLYNIIESVGVHH